jgi:hypothetical protein
MGYIYRIKNKIDNKTYIGQTIQDLDDRWRDHLNKHSNCRYLKSAFKKYGVDNFEFQLVCITFDNCLDDMEIKYIQHYNCLVPNGYNLRLGGNSGKHNEETKRKIAATLLKNKKVVQFDIQGNRLNTFNSTVEAAKYVGRSRSVIGHCCNGDIKTAAGYVWKYESINSNEVKIEPLTGRFKGWQKRIKKEVIPQINRKIVQFDMDGNRLKSFNTCKEAAEYIGTSRSCITHCCLGQHKTAKGYVWKYESINSSDTNYEGQNEIYKQINEKRNRVIVQFDMAGNRLNTFKSCREAGRHVGTCNGNISLCCNGIRLSSKGYIWKYEPIV